MKARLIESLGAGPIREFPLQGDTVLLGRGDDCDLTIHDQEVSRHHCEIRLRAGEASAADLGSSNGTFVNGKRLVSTTRLKTGDELRLGGAQFVVDLGDDPTFQVPESASDPQTATRTVKDLRKELERRGLA